MLALAVISTFFVHSLSLVSAAPAFALAPTPTLVARSVPHVGTFLGKRADVPACVVDCIGTAATTAGCTTSDYNCLCRSAVFIDATAVCFAGSCTDQQALWGVETGYNACLAIGVTESFPPTAVSVLATKTTAGTSGALDDPTVSADVAVQTAPSSSSASNSAASFATNAPNSGAALVDANPKVGLALVLVAVGMSVGTLL